MKTAGSMTRETFAAMDDADSLAGYRDEFELAPDLIYLDGNSLGPVTRSARQHLNQTMDIAWRQDLIQSWNKHSWIDLPAQIGNRIGKLIGAAQGQVVVADSTSINLYKLLNTALSLRPGRHEVLSNSDNFPTDLYMVQGLASQLSQNSCQLKLTSTDQILDAVTTNTAVVMLTEVDFRTGQRLDMSTLTREVQKMGALMLWDLSHSAGAFPVELDNCQVDLAIGCGYKYLNGGPGAPGYLYVAERHQTAANQPLWGWMGHASAFEFSADYQPAAGINRFLVGTPPILSMACLSGALDVIEAADLTEIRMKSERLSDLFIQLMAADPALACFQLRSPISASFRGSHLSYAHPDAYAMIQALIAHKVIGDFRAPDLLRFGFAPLYTRYVDVWDTVQLISEMITSETHYRDEFQVQNKVT